MQAETIVIPTSVNKMDESYGKHRKFLLSD